MKKTNLLFITILSLFIFSCSKSTVDPPEPTDDFKLLTVTSEGKVFEIANVTQTPQYKGHITNQSNLIILSTLCNVGTNIYCIESTYVPSPNVLIIYNKVNGTTTTHQLVLPPSVTSSMNDPFITNIKYNGSELIAVVNENMPNNSHPNKIISINLQNYSTTDLGIDFFQRTITSTELINNNLFISTTNDGLLKVDLTQKTVTELQANGVRINASRLSKIGTTKLGIMKFVPQVVNGVQPFEFDLSTNTITDKSAGEIYALGNILGSSVYKNDNYYNILYNSTGSLGLLKINYLTNQKEFISLGNNVLSANTIIVDVVY